ncbi:MAG: CRISPR-associated endonuclease Cas2 [Synechococcaceae cyanobacterium RL_1_2]|nr:CRISPR-associated endonuclease Cas2 [Synechococcaceae cyanobacterium RL_1_2]
MLYVVTYDITDNKRRQKVAHILEGYGSRVQFSVFECHLSRKQYGKLCQRLWPQGHWSEGDSLRFYPISGHTLAQVTIWGEPPLTNPPSSIVI